LNKKEWHETDKYLNRALKIYQHLKMDNAIYLKEIIWIYSALAKTNRYLEQDNYMNSEIFFEKALDEISHLDKNADEYKRYQHIIQKQRQIYFDEKQQNVFTNINNDLKQIQRVLKQQAELQQKNTTQIQALYCLLNQKQKANKNKLTMLIETIKKLF
jgi:hypothetical protein